jgi:inhibitor of KinA sporulation pathway (predicted exonuclease)
MPTYPPFVPGQSFNTRLDPGQEQFFRQWVQQNNVPFNPNAAQSDYDMRGYYRGLMNGNPMARPQEVNANDGRPHFTDYYKTPQHQTFSNESQWAGASAPTWINDHQLSGQNGRIVFDERPYSFSALFGK